jgi:hypothetical protein
MKSEKDRIREQYSQAEWDRLCADSKFMEAWNSSEYIKAQELAAEITQGNISAKKQSDISVIKALLKL